MSLAAGWRARALVAFLTFAVAVMGLPLQATPATAISSNIVISQVYGGGGNANAPFQNDFIELFNRGTSATSLSGWSVQYGSASGSTWTVTNLTNTSLAPGRYYLVREAPGNSCSGVPCGAPLPTADAAATIAMAAGGAKVALVSSTTALSGACPASASIVDLVGYGTGSSLPNCSETSSSATLTNTTAGIRKSGGCTDTDNNSADFASGTPLPRNTSSPIHVCGTPQFTLTITNAGGGIVTSADAQINCGAFCSYPYDQGTSVVLSAAPSTGASFLNWSGAGCSGTGTCTVTMTTAAAVTANFAEPLNITISGTGTVTSADGSINCPGSCSASFKYGSTAQITATPAPGWAATNWSGDCGGVGTCGILMTAPRNVRANFVAAPTVTTTSPTDGGSDVPLGAAIQVTFSEPVTVHDNDWYTLSCTHGTTPTATTSGSSNIYTVTPTAPFANGQTCTVRILAAGVQNASGVHLPATYEFKFATQIRIHDIQGATHYSVYAGETVGQVPGIVTAIRSNGFYFQDPNADGDPRTSEGMFVLASGALLSGRSLNEAITVDGSVAEFAFDSTQLSTTEIRATAVAHTGTGPAITPTIIGTGGRIPPTTVIENDTSGDVNTTDASFDPDEDGLDFYESLEGMLVQVNGAITTSRTEPRFGELWVIGDLGANASVLTPRGGIVITDPDGNPANADFNPERIMVDDEVFKAGSGVDPACATLGGSSGMPCVNVGATFTGPLVGVIDYDFSTYRIQLLAKPTVASNPLTQESTVAQGPGELAIATFNVQNLAPGDPASKYTRLAGIIVNNLKSPDIVALEEIQDNTGAAGGGGDTVVAADQTFNKLISFITAAGGPSYQWRSIDPVYDQDGGAPHGNIRVGYIFRTDRGLAFIDRPGGTSTSANAVVGTGAGTHLLYSPGRIDPANAAWNSSRKPLAAEWTFNGHHLFTIANHFNSKGGDESLYGDDQPPQRSSEVQRHKQAPIVNAFVKQIETADPNADIVVLGDLNDFQFSDTLTLLKGSELHTLIDTLPANEQYTYVFEGNSQAIDHTLLSNHTFTSVPWTYDIVHLNSEFADNASDHEPQVTRLYLPDTTAPVVTAPADTTAEATSPSGAAVDYGTCTATDDITPQADLVFDYSPANNSTFPLGTTAVECGATDAGGNRGTAMFHVHVVDTTPPTITAPPPQTVEATSPAGAVATYACTASDIAGPVTVSNPGSGNTFPLGTTTVTCTATDQSGNIASANTTITVVDTTPPSITAQTPQTLEATSPSGAVATYTCTASDSAGPVTISTPGSGGTFPLGTTTVACTATDQANNSSSATTTITVVDTTPPSITAPAPQTVEATSPAGAVATYSCTASDIAGPVTISTPGSGSTFPLGTTTVTCTATDQSGNTASANTTITVVDTTPPSIVAPAPQTIEATSPAGAVATYECTASDSAGPVTVSNPGSGGTFPLGTTSVTCTATDQSNSSSSATTTITVVDTTAPTIVGSRSPLANGYGWNNTPVTVHFTCSDFFLASCTPDVTLSGDGAGQSVTGTATDTSGNSASATVSGINIDRTAPTIGYSGNAGTYTVDQTITITCSASDALSGLATNTCANITVPASSFLGTHTYTATATDKAGNTSSASATFTVGVTADSLCAVVRSVVSNTGIANSLCQKLKNAEAAEARGNHTAAQNLLDAFDNEVSAQSGKAMTAANANLLRSLAAAF